MNNLWVWSPVAMGILLAIGIDGAYSHNQYAVDVAIILMLTIIEGLLYRVLKNQEPK